jgi:hypothetical protein
MAKTSAPIPSQSIPELAQLLSAESLALLRTTLSTHPTLIIIEAPGAVAELVAPEAFATLVPTAQARAADTHLLVPEGESWTTAEIHNELLAPSQLTPLVRNVFFVQEANTISPALFDHLLKTIEEPLAPTTFILAAPSAQSLPLTIRSRASQVLALQPTHADLARWLLSAGLPDELCQRAARVLPDAAVLLAGLTDRPELAEKLVHAAHTLPDRRTPATLAHALAELITIIAETTIDPTASSTMPASKEATQARRRARRIARSVLDAWRTLTVEALVANPALSTRAGARLTTLDTANDLLARNGQPEIALALAIAA